MGSPKTFLADNEEKFANPNLTLVSAIFKRQIYFFIISNEVQWKEI